MGVLRQLLEEIFLKSINNILQGTALLVPSSAETTILTLSATQDHRVVKIACSGCSYARYKIYKNTVLIENKLSSPKYAIDFEFDYPLKLVSGDILDVKVEHFFTGEQLDFDSTIYSIV